MSIGMKNPIEVYMGEQARMNLWKKKKLSSQESKRYIIFDVPEIRRDGFKPSTPKFLLGIEPRKTLLETSFARVLSISMMSMTSCLVQRESMCQVIQKV